MSDYPNGAYHYYLKGASVFPRICEVNGQYAWFTDDDGPVLVSKLSGKLVRLVEQRQPGAGVDDAPIVK